MPEDFTFYWCHNHGLCITPYLLRVAGYQVRQKFEIRARFGGPVQSQMPMMQLNKSSQVPSGGNQECE